MAILSLLDGVGISVKDKVERLLIESSGNDDWHTEEDTLKQISNTVNCLVMDLKTYKLASYDTFLERQIFGIQAFSEASRPPYLTPVMNWNTLIFSIDEKMTLTSTRLVAPNRYAFVEIRSATIPTEFGERWKWAKVIELLLKLKRDLLT